MRTTSVAVDGRGGAGESPLVEQLRAAVPSSGVVHTDDVAWHHAYFDWGALMVEHVLRPLHRGDAVDWRPRAWGEHGRPGAIRVPAGSTATRTPRSSSDHPRRPATPERVR